MKAIVLFVSVSGLLAAASWDKKDLNAAQLNALGLELSQKAHYPDAEQAYRRSLAEWDRFGPKAMLSRAVTAGNLGTLLQVEGRYAEAETLLVSSLKQIEDSTGAQSREAGRAEENLAALYLAWGQPKQANTYAEHAQTIFAEAADEKEARVGSRRLLAAVLLAERRFTQGEEMMQAVLPELSERAAVGAYNDLAVAATSQGRLEEAEPLALKALDTAHHAYASDHPLVAVSLNNLAQIQRFQGRYLESEKNYRDAIDIWKRALGPQHPDVAKGLMNLAAFYHDRGRDAGAEDLYREAAAIFTTAYGKDNPLTLVARNELGETLRAQGRYTESEKLSKDTLHPLENSLGTQDPRVIRALGNYARLLDETQHARDAAAVRQRIETLRKGFLDPGR